MAFFKKVSQSVYSPSFYSEIVQGKTGSAAGYLALLALFLAVVSGLGLAKPLFVTFPKGAKEFSGKMANYFPSDLVVSIKGGKISINKTEPYFLDMPFDIGNVAKDETISHLAVIDTKTAFSFEKFAEYKSLFWLTKDSLATVDGRNKQAKIVPLSDTKDMSFDRAGYDGLMTKLAPFVKFVVGFGGPVLFGLALLFIFLGHFFGTLLFLLFFAIVVWIVGMFFSLHHTYWQSYKISVHAITLGLICKTAISAIAFFSGNFMGTPTYLVSAITLAVVVANFMGMKKIRHAS